VAKQTDVEQLEQGVAKWNAWRFDGSPTPDLSGANLRGADLSRADFSDAMISQTQLDKACGTDVKVNPGLKLNRTCPPDMHKS